MNNYHAISSQSTRGRITVPARTLFKEKSPEGSFPDTVKDVYFSTPDSDEHLSATNLKANQQYRSLLDQAVSEGLIDKKEAKTRQQNFQKGALGPWAPASKDSDGVMAQLRELEDSRFCLTHVPQQCGDGLYRPMDFYVSPGHLDLKAKAQNWEMKKNEDGKDVPVADTVVVGGGPAGLSTAWQTARRGGRVVCFEAELAGSAFSDNTAKSVHHMRTSAFLTSLIREGNTRVEREHPLSLFGQLASYRNHAKEGRESQLELTGAPVHGIYQDSLGMDEHSPATRGELFEHLSTMAYSLAHDFDDAVLAERSPVTDISFEDGLYTIKTSRGHEVKAKHLVVSTGLTGPQGERGRMLPVFDSLAQADPESYTILGKDGDSLQQSDKLEAIANNKQKSGLVINDRLLGDQAVRQTIASLPEGSRAAVVGSGESALKGALEMLHLHPGLKVDLFVKDKLESAQVQLPLENFHPAVLENTQDDPDAIKAAEAAFRVFDTPVTPRSLQELFEFQQSGRARLIEMGAYFDENSMELTPQGNGTTKLSVKDPKMARTIQENTRAYKAKGLMPSDTPDVEGSDYQVFVQSVGYRKLPPSENPLLQLGPEAQKNLHINTSGAAIHPAQTSLPGLATRGRHLAEQMAEDIPLERRIDLNIPPFWQDRDPEEVQGIIANRGLHPGFVKSVKDAIERDGSHPQEIRLTFTADDTRLRDLAAIPEEKRTKAEQETLERGYLLANKMKEYSERNGNSKPS